MKQTKNKLKKREVIKNSGLEVYNSMPGEIKKLVEMFGGYSSSGRVEQRMKTHRVV